MRNYEERTQAVLNKIEEYKNGKKAETAQTTKPVWYKSSVFIRRISTAAAALVLLVALNLVLFLPYPDANANVSAYANSPYYELIKVVNDLTYSKPQYGNNFEAWTDGLFPSGGSNKGDGDVGLAGADASPGGADRPNDIVPPAAPTSPGSSDKYEETTNNQVDGVIEGDLLKRSTEYAYYLLPCDANAYKTAYLLRIYHLAGMNTSLISEYEIKAEEDTYFYYTAPEMFLSKDCKSVTLVLHANKYNAGGYTCLIRLDVSKPEAVKETNRIYVSGSYLSSRMTDNLLLFTKFTVYNNPDFSDESKFLPQTGKIGDMKSLPIEDIIFSSDATFARYTVVCKLDLQTLEIKDSLAFLSYSENAYVSESNIFLAQTKSEITTLYPEYSRKWDFARNYSVIACVNYSGEGLTLKGNATVNGTILDQYSMDEYENVLRVATTTNNFSTRTDAGIWYTTYTSASLFCIDLNSFKTIGKVENFAPERETVRSARFDKDKAYVCTAVQNTDPVFAFDLSDYNNITYTHTGEITGFSTSLIKFTYGTLLGIGIDGWSDLKIEIYGEAENKVESLAKYTLDCSFSSKFKAYYIDAERGLIGLGVYVYDYKNQSPSMYRYMLFRFNGETIEVEETIYLDNNLYRDFYDYIRTAYAEGYIYVFSQSGVNVINWNEI